MRNFLFFIILTFLHISDSRLHTRKRRIPSAFSLARIQKDYDDYTGEDNKSNDGWLRRDEVVSDTKCLHRCNNRLNVGMDMVNAHMSFGSIDVPSVVGKRDLDLFCLLDKEHSECIDECGYSVQFNLREYVCRNRFEEMRTHLPCYSRASPLLTRHCRPRCGGYSSLEHTYIGYSHRCRQLLCDHTCIAFILRKVCGERKGRRAASFLMDFTQLQVEYWIREYSSSHHIKSYPTSCSRLLCTNCTTTSSRRRYL